MIKFASISPHPPIIIPSVGSPDDLKRVKKTIEGMKKLEYEFRKAEPETVIVVSPHGPVALNYFTALSGENLCGNFQMFGDYKTEFCFKNDFDFLRKIEETSQRESVPFRRVDISELDHGSLVPLYYLSQNWKDFRLVSLAFSFLGLEEHYRFGNVLSEIARSYKKSVGFVASGDLSHRLTIDAPAGFSPRGKEFDRKIVELLKKKDVEGILNMDPELVEEAGECGYRSIVVLLGFLKDLNWEPEFISYEGPFGVGYLVMNFRIK